MAADEWLRGRVGPPGIPGAKGADGVTPHIDAASGHWMIGETDTGVPARGDRGLPGERGETGPQGKKGDKGDPGEKGDPFTYADFTPEQLAALKGEKGDKGDKGEQGEKGASGADGRTPVKGVDYFTPDEKTEIAAEAAGMVHIPVDDSLTMNGQAADAKATGDALRAVSAESAELKQDKADKTALARTDRSLDALWKLNQGISYRFETDNAAAYQKAVPGGAKLASVEQIGGKTVAWNLLIKNSNFNDMTEWMPVRTATYTVDKNIAAFKVSTQGGYLGQNVYPASQHQYFLSVDLKGESDGYPAKIWGIYGYLSKTVELAAEWKKFSYICKNEYNEAVYSQIYVQDNSESGWENIYIKNFLLFDLTQIFGSGNEPATTDDPRIAWIEQYAEAHPEYNAGELVSAEVNDVVCVGKNLADNALLTNNLGVDRSGQLSEITGRVAINGYIDVSTFDKVTLSCAYTGASVFIYALWNDDTLVERKASIPDGSTIDVSLGNKLLVCVYHYYNHVTIDDVKYIQVEAGSVATAYSPYHLNTYPIPAAIRSLPGYGWSAGDVYNSIERTDTGWQYVQRVGCVDLGTLDYIRSAAPQRFEASQVVPSIAATPTDRTPNVICDLYVPVPSESGSYPNMCIYINANGFIRIHDASRYSLTGDEFKTAMSGVMLYYELVDAIITDITDLMADFLNHFEAEAGGTITMDNTARLPVPNRVEYLISLAEVNRS